MTSDGGNARRGGSERDAALAAYHSAVEALDERPSPAAREAILAAATRAAGARPQAVDMHVVAADDRSATVARTRWWQRFHLPMAAAATVLISTIAGLVALRTGEELPPDTAGPIAPPPAAVEAPTAGVPPVTGEPRTADSAPGRTPPVSITPPAAPSRVPAEGSPGAGPREPSQAPRAESAPTPPVGAGRIRDAESARVAPPLPPAAPAPPAITRAPEALPPPAGLASRAAEAQPPWRPAASAPPLPDAGAAAALGAPPAAAAAGQSATEQSAGGPSTLVRGRAAGAPPLPGASASHDGRDLPRDDPVAWSARIAELRRAGRDAEADGELKQLRLKYPEFVVPESALRHTDAK